MGRATAGTLAFVAAPQGLGQCGEGTVLNCAFLWWDFEVARVVLVDLCFHCLVQLEVLGMVDAENKSKSRLINQQPADKKLKNFNSRSQ